jgi:hypothetical protein
MSVCTKGRMLLSKFYKGKLRDKGFTQIKKMRNNKFCKEKSLLSLSQRRKWDSNQFHKRKYRF